MMASSVWQAYRQSQIDYDAFQRRQEIMVSYCVGWSGFSGCGKYTNVDRGTMLCTHCLSRWWKNHPTKKVGKNDLLIIN